MLFWARRIFLDFKVWLTKPSLVRAAKRGNIGKVRRLLKRGVPVDVSDGFGRTALMEAAREDNLEIVQLLLEHGADVQVRTGIGKTAMSYAKGRLVRELLSRGEPAQERVR